MIKKTQRKAFTLLELLVVVALLGILGTVATDIFFNVSRAYNKANVIIEVGRNGNIALTQMVGEIRNARVLRFPAPGDTGTSLTINDVNGREVTFSFVEESGDENGYVARDGISLTDNAFASGVNVTDLSFFVVPGADPSVVRIMLSLSQPLGLSRRVDFQAATTLETTVSLRTYR